VESRQIRLCGFGHNGNKVDRIGNKVEHIGNESRLRQALESTLLPICCEKWQQSLTYTVTVDFVADLLPVSATVDFQQSRPCRIQLCRQSVTGFRLQSQTAQECCLRLVWPSRININNVQTWASLQGDSLYEAEQPDHCWDSLSHSRPIWYLHVVLPG